MQMARRLTSFIELRNVPPEYATTRPHSYVADDRAIRYRQQASPLDGIVDFRTTSRSLRPHLAYFDEVWREPDPARFALPRRSTSDGFAAPRFPICWA